MTNGKRHWYWRITGVLTVTLTLLAAPSALANHLDKAFGGNPPKQWRIRASDGLCQAGTWRLGGCSDAQANAFNSALTGTGGQMVKVGKNWWLRCGAVPCTTEQNTQADSYLRLDAAPQGYIPDLSGAYAPVKWLQATPTVSGPSRSTQQYQSEQPGFIERQLALMVNSLTVGIISALNLPTLSDLVTLNYHNNPATGAVRGTFDAPTWGRVSQWYNAVEKWFALPLLVVPFILMGVHYSLSAFNPRQRREFMDSLRSTAAAVVLFNLTGSLALWLLNTNLVAATTIAQPFSFCADNGSQWFDPHLISGNCVFGGRLADAIINLAAIGLLLILTFIYTFRSILLQFLFALAPLLGGVAWFFERGRPIAATFWREYALLAFQPATHALIISVSGITDSNTPLATRLIAMAFLIPMTDLLRSIVAPGSGGFATAARVFGMGALLGAWQLSSVARNAFAGGGTAGGMRPPGAPSDIAGRSARHGQPLAGEAGAFGRILQTTARARQVMGGIGGAVGTAAGAMVGFGAGGFMGAAVGANVGRAAGSVIGRATGGLPTAVGRTALEMRRAGQPGAGMRDRMARVFDTRNRPVGDSVRAGYANPAAVLGMALGGETGARVAAGIAGSIGGIHATKAEKDAADQFKDVDLFPLGQWNEVPPVPQEDYPADMFTEGDGGALVLNGNGLEIRRNNEVVRHYTLDQLPDNLRRSAELAPDRTVMRRFRWTGGEPQFWTSPLTIVERQRPQDPNSTVAYALEDGPRPRRYTSAR